MSESPEKIWASFPNEKIVVARTYKVNTYELYIRAPTWISVEDRLPEDPRRVLLTWVNTLGNRRITCGLYAGPYTISADHEDIDDPDAFDWKNEEPYRVPGWYEEPWESEYYARIIDSVTHWMPLPAPPGELMG